MTGIYIAIALALLSAAAIMLLGRVSFAAMLAPAAALMVGLAGYAWQGHPGLSGHPVSATKTGSDFNEEMAQKRRELGARFGDSAKWLTVSDGLARAGNTKDAANVLVSALRSDPDNAELWVGLGNALLAHGDGMLSPAAQDAYQRALTLDPDGVSANYFYGLALAQSGQFDAGKSIWTHLISLLPQKAELRGELARNVALIDALIARRDAVEKSALDNVPDKAP